ncbi:hypothetical protein FSP39_008041 [Pinctada imbricata]|uniref:Uncharacterized protein n=1 Tax=Pinctada imbricata TaxID=66713 RepID=A0AA88YUV5_PINIB|nr:hypothetical protein FSP39_008041 [Pinctada imbricata]
MKESNSENNPEDRKMKFPFTIEHLPVWLQMVISLTLAMLVLVTGCFSRILVHIMLWKLSPPLTNDRRLKLASIFGFLKADDEFITRDTTCTDFSCSKGLPLSWTCIDIGGQTCTLAETVPITGVGWFWAVMLSISAPYIYTFVINLYKCCTKVTPKINHKVIIMVRI